MTPARASLFLFALLQSFACSSDPAAPGASAGTSSAAAGNAGAGNVGSGGAFSAGGSLITTAGSAATATSGAPGAGASGTASAGAASAGNQGGQAGAGQATGQKPFPQHKYGSFCKYPSQTDDAVVRSAYQTWKEVTVTSDGAGGALRVKKPDSGTIIGSTVSEGIGY